MCKTFPELLKLMSTYVCDTQAALSQYIFLAAKKHRDLEEFLAGLKRLPTEKDLDEERRKLNGLVADLDEHLLIKFGEAFDATYEYSLKYFGARGSSLPPRMTLKVILTSDRLVTLFKIPETRIYHADVGLAENSAFSTIADGNGYYFCNDIPKAIEKGVYHNPRIDEHLAKAYESSAHVPLSSYDKSWAHVWHKVNLVGTDEFIESPPETCYKSTLVVPVSLETDKLASEFRDRFKISDDSDRALFGFLCLDHPTVNFFKENVDVHFVSVITDILSLYLINQMRYTNFSSIYYEAKLWPLMS